MSLVPSGDVDDDLQEIDDRLVRCVRVLYMLLSKV